MKTTVSEAEHPLLCEGTRREKGELASALMVTYKDDQSKLKKVGLFWSPSRDTSRWLKGFLDTGSFGKRLAFF